LNFCLENRLPIIEDGAYQELCFDESVMPLKALDKNGSVMYLGSSSKTLAPGLRIGWVVADEPIIKRLGDVKMQMDYGASSLSQWTFTEFLNSGLYYEYVKQLKQKLKQRRDNALKVLENNFKDIATWQVPEGGFYIWLTFKNNVQVDQLFEKSVQHKILLNPGDMYDFKHNRSLRLSYAYVNQTEFEQSILILRKII
jgi:Transcriptional regulators containing a DNA-binding HTH domain and an aminotransferase domain (MocR family) and their eukaryotic orthologs